VSLNHLIKAVWKVCANLVRRAVTAVGGVVVWHGKVGLRVVVRSVIRQVVVSR